MIVGPTDASALRGCEGQGLLGMMQRIEEFEVLLAYDFARLARNQEDLGWIRNRLRTHRKRAFEASPTPT